jgi:hypothetical protein
MTSSIVDSQNRKKNLDIMSRLPRKAGKMLGLSTTPDCLKAKEEVRKEQSHESFVWMFKNRSEEMLPGEDVGVDKDLALYLREHEGLVKDIDSIRKDFLTIVNSAERTSHTNTHTH